MSEISGMLSETVVRSKYSEAHADTAVRETNWPEWMDE